MLVYLMFDTAYGTCHWSFIVEQQQLSAVEYTVMQLSVVENTVMLYLNCYNCRSQPSAAIVAG